MREGGKEGGTCREGRREGGREGGREGRREGNNLGGRGGRQARKRECYKNTVTSDWETLYKFIHRELVVTTNSKAALLLS